MTSRSRTSGDGGRPAANTTGPVTVTQQVVKNDGTKGSRPVRHVDTTHPHRRSRHPDQVAGDRLLRRVTAEAGGWLWPLIALGLVGVAATIALPLALGRALDDLVAGYGAAAESSPVTGSLLLAIALVGVLAVEEVVGQWLAGAGTARATAASANGSALTRWPPGRR